MHSLLLFLFLLLAFFSEAQDIDVLHYRFFVEVSDKSDTIEGFSVITLVLKKQAPVVSLDLASVNVEGKGMKVLAAYNSDHSDSTIVFQQKGEKLYLSVAHIKANDTFQFFIAYKGVPKDGLIISKNKYGDRTFFADNWPNRAHYWIPCNDRPDDKATFEFRVTAPSEYTVISNGIQNGAKILKGFSMKKTTTWTEDTPLPTKVMVIGVAKFATKVFDDSPKDVPVSAWVYPQDSAKGFYDYALTTDIIKFFSDYIAPFPYKKLANVQSKTIFGGMENASCIFYAESSVTGDRSNEDLYAHEIAHQWFGDMASEKSFAHLWLSEGFATYMTDVYFEHKYGKEAMNKRLKKERDEAIAFAKTSTHSVVDSTTNLMSLLNANSYQKGAWVLHMLRQEVGDSAFHKIIQTYYNQYKGSNADTRDFEAVAEKLSGKELTWFFDQWLYRPSVPQLSVKKEKDGKRIKVTIVQKGSIYRIPLTMVLLQNDGMVYKEKLLLTGRETESSWKGDDVTIRLDPDSKLLFEEVK